MLNRIESSGPKLSLQDIEAAEQQLNVMFPDSYRRFLLDHNGGRPIPSSLLVANLRSGTEAAEVELDQVIPPEIAVVINAELDSDMEVEIEEAADETQAPENDELNAIEVGMFYGIGLPADSEADLVPLMEAYVEGEVLLTKLPIATSGGDDHFLLETQGPNCGKVYQWYSLSPPEDGMTLIADSFEKFLEEFSYVEAELPWRELIDESDLAGMKAWLENGGDPNAKDLLIRGDTPLEYAVNRGEYDLVVLLRRHGAKRNQQMVYSAIYQGNLPIVKLFLQEGVGRDELNEAKSRLGDTNDEELNRLLQKS